MKRFKVRSKRDRRIFSKTASNVRSENFIYLMPTRGGHRM